VFPAPRARLPFRALGRSYVLGRSTWVVGILNCTPDSFSDGGRHAEGEAAVRRLAEIVEEGADLCDIGGESTRPGALPVSVEEEWSRVAPVLEAARRLAVPIPLSIDTTKGEVARRALHEGVAVINDVSALRFDPTLGDLAASSGAGIILMHSRGEPRTMQDAPFYQDVAGEVARELERSLAEARRRGVADEQILLDPGIGFAKSAEHNWELLRRLPELTQLGRPLLVGASRKRFLGAVLDLPPEERLEASLSAHAAAVLAGASLVRAHDVRATVRAVRVADALRGSAA